MPDPLTIKRPRAASPVIQGLGWILVLVPVIVFGVSRYSKRKPVVEPLPEDTLPPSPPPGAV